MYSRFFRTGELLINSLLLASLYLILISAHHTQYFTDSDNDQDLTFVDPGRKSISINFKMANNLIIVPIQINNSDTLWFILDTGISQSVITDLPGPESIYLKDARKIELKVPGSASPVRALHSSGNETNLSGLKGNNQDYYVLIDENLNLSRKIGFPVHGILSFSVLKSFVVEINYENQVITVYQSGQYPYSSLARKNPPMRLSVIDNKPYAITRLEPEKGISIPAKLLIDTGLSNSIWLNKNSVPEEITPGEYRRSYLGCGIAGEVYGSISRMSNIRLNHHIISNPIVCYPDSSDLLCSMGTSDNTGSLGAEILKRFTVLIDYPDSLITLTKNTAFSEEFNMNMTGMELIATGSDYRSYEISQIRPDSPAEKAGLKISDEIISIEDIPVTSYTLSDIYSLLRQQEGNILTFTINRKGEKLNLDVKLEAFI